MNNTHPEVGKDIFSLNILCSQSDLPVRLILILLKISKTDLKDSMFEPFRSNL